MLAAGRPSGNRRPFIGRRENVNDRDRRALNRQVNIRANLNIRPRHCFKLHFHLIITAHILMLVIFLINVDIPFDVSLREWQKVIVSQQWLDIPNTSRDIPNLSTQM